MITQDIKYIGVNDHKIDLFEGQYIVPEGMAYNSYVIKDQKTAVMDSVDINFAVFNRFLFPGQLEGFFFALFAIGVSAAETAVAIAIIINIYRNIRNIQVKNLNEMKH